MQTDGHTLSSFDRDLEALQTHLLRMWTMVEAALSDSVTALETRDLDLANRVIEMDRAIDALDDQINTEAAGVIALRGPTASDLRLVLAVMRAAHSLERVGDYAKNVAKRTKVLVQIPELPGFSGTTRRMAKLVAVMLEQAMRALVRRDAVLAETVRQSDADIDQMYNNMFRSLLTHMLESPTNITAAMHLHFIAKNIERAGDHATGIAEQAIYLATGHFPNDARPKVDPTSAFPEPTTNGASS
ncbi:MAG: phosphate signaling complex protein PhoU [Paracoccaceae bacterium]